MFATLILHAVFNSVSTSPIYNNESLIGSAISRKYDCGSPRARDFQVVLICVVSLLVTFFLIPSTVDI